MKDGSAPFAVKINDRGRQGDRESDRQPKQNSAKGCQPFFLQHRIGFRDRGVPLHHNHGKHPDESVGFHRRRHSKENPGDEEPEGGAPGGDVGVRGQAAQDREDHHVLALHDRRGTQRKIGQCPCNPPHEPRPSAELSHPQPAEADIYGQEGVIQEADPPFRIAGQSADEQAGKICPRPVVFEKVAVRHDPEFIDQ